MTPRAVVAARTAVTLALLPLLAALAVVPAAAQSRQAEPPPPSRADEYLAQGRLALAERELYAAVAREPREPSHRGALGRYVASRGRFRIAEVLFLEALRFGADTPSVARALAMMDPYRPRSERKPIPGVRSPVAVVARDRARAVRGGDEVIDGVEVTVPLEAVVEGGGIARVRARGARGPVWVVLDPSREGIAISGSDDSALVAESFGGRGSGSPALVEELWIGERRLAWLDAYIDQSVPSGEVRIGIDVMWRLRVIVDARGPESTLTLPFAGARATLPPHSFHLPVLLRFPGLLLVPEPGAAPYALASPQGRAYLRRARWQLDPETSTLIVTR